MSDDNIVFKTLYLHRGKDSNWELWDSLAGGPPRDHDAGFTFSYTALEVGLACTINTSTGRAAAYGIIDGDGKLVEFERPVSL